MNELTNVDIKILANKIYNLYDKVLIRIYLKINEKMTINKNIMIHKDTKLINLKKSIKKIFNIKDNEDYLIKFKGNILNNYNLELSTYINTENINAIDFYLFKSNAFG